MIQFVLQTKSPRFAIGCGWNQTIREKEINNDDLVSQQWNQTISVGAITIEPDNKRKDLEVNLEDQPQK